MKRLATLGKAQSWTLSSFLKRINLMTFVNISNSDLMISKLVLIGALCFVSKLNFCTKRDKNYLMTLSSKRIKKRFFSNSTIFWRKTTKIQLPKPYLLKTRFSFCNSIICCCKTKMLCYPMILRLCMIHSHKCHNRIDFQACQMLQILVNTMRQLRQIKWNIANQEKNKNYNRISSHLKQLTIDSSKRLRSSKNRSRFLSHRCKGWNKTN